MKILSFGEIVWDIYPDKKCLGGTALNFAAHLALHGNEVFLNSAVGDDPLGIEAIEQIKKWNISPKYIQTVKGKPTGQCVVTLLANGAPSYNLLCDVAYDEFVSENIPNDFDVLYFGTLPLRSVENFDGLNSLIHTHNFKEIFVDMNIRPPFYSHRSVNFALEQATILKLSLEELCYVAEALDIDISTNYKDFAKILSERYSNLKLIVVTLGGDGAYALDTESNVETACSAERVNVVSTVGAGDSFSAAFLHKYLLNASLENSLQYATRIAGYVVSKYDAIPEYEVKDFI